jgi:hypothetical protein
MKRLIIFLSMLGLFISVNAFGAATSVPVNQLVTVPIQDAGWHVGAEVLYLQPSNSDLDYATIHTNSGTIHHYDVRTVKPKYQLGFGVDAGFHFQGTGTDLSAHYERLHSNDYSAITGGTIYARLLPGWSLNTFNRANARVKYNYNAADALLGQLVDVGHRLHTHLAAGLRYADLGSSIHANYYTAVYNFWALVKSSFKGIGPRFALNGTYDLYRGFNFDAGVGTSLLIGSMKASNFSFYDQSSYYNSIKKGHIVHIVPELDAKLGLSYNHLLCKGKLTIMGGWKVINYFNAQDYLLFPNSSSTQRGIFVNSMSNICFNGPYLGFVFKV